MTDPTSPHPYTFPDGWLGAAEGHPCALPGCGKGDRHPIHAVPYEPEPAVGCKMGVEVSPGLATGVGCAFGSVESASPTRKPSWESLLGDPDVYLDGEADAVEAIRRWVGIPAPVLPIDRFIYLSPPPPST